MEMLNEETMANVKFRLSCSMEVSEMFRHDVRLFGVKRKTSWEDAESMSATTNSHTGTSTKQPLTLHINHYLRYYNVRVSIHTVGVWWDLILT